MQSIPALKNVSFETIEEKYIPLAAHFPAMEKMLENGENAILEEYDRVLQMPIYERAQYHDPLSYTAVSVPNIGLPIMSLNVAILFALAINLTNCIDIDEVKYRVVVFDRRVLNRTFGINVMDLIKEMFEVPDNDVQIEVKKSGSKIMFITPEES